MAVAPELLGQAAGEAAAERLALLLAIDDGLVQQPEPTQPPFCASARILGNAQEELLDVVGDGLGRGPPRGGDGLDGLALGHEAEELLLVLRQIPLHRDRGDEGVDDGRVEGGATTGHGPHRLDELVPLGEAVLEQVPVAGGTVGQEADGVLGVVVLREDDDPCAGVTLAQLPGRLDALPLERGGHADVGDDDLGGEGVCARHELVVVGRDADHLEVRLALEQRLDALSHDEVVVGEEDRDLPRRHLLLRHGVPRPRPAGRYSTVNSAVIPWVKWGGPSSSPPTGMKQTIV